VRIFLLAVLAIGSIWNAFTTMYGTIQILGNTTLQILTALLFSALVFGFLLNTRAIMKWHSGFLSSIAKFFWFVALSYNFFTSWIGNSNLLLSRNLETTTVIILIGLILLVTASPVLLSALWQSRAFSSPDAEMRRA
jgi:hypothetical protein